MSRLSDTQQLFLKLITQPGGTDAVLEKLSEEERAAARELIREGGRLTPAERCDVYANMYFFRILEVLKEDYPGVLGVVGEGSFQNLATDYLLAHPPSHFSLRNAGEQLPAFLGRHPLLENWPYLSELARFERAMIESFDAPDAEPLGRETLARVAPERWGELRFTLSPSLRVLESPWPIIGIWESARAGSVAPLLDAELTRLRVWRKDLKVWHRTIDASEREALAAIEAQARLADVCERLATDLGEEGAVARVVRLLDVWVADGLICAVG